MAEAQPYDVFFSYAWATQTGNPVLRDWCRKVADTIAALLSQRFNAQDPPFRAYLDRDAARAGQDLPAVLKGAVRCASVFVVMVSDFYDSPYCRDEIGWFSDWLAEVGLRPEDHLCILRVQESSRGWWPAQLRGPGGEPLLYLDFCDGHGQPLEMARFVMGAAMPELAGPIEKAVLEIGEKVKSARDRAAAKRAYQPGAQALPDRPILYFEAEESDRERWRRLLPALMNVPSIVLPGPLDATGASPADYEGCDGMVMLRSRPSDNIGRRIKLAYLQRRQLGRQAKPNLPWVLLDELETPPPEGESFLVPRVRPGDGWVDEVRRALWG